MSTVPQSLDAAYERQAMEQGLVKNPVFPENKDYDVQKPQDNPTPDYYNKQYRGIKLDPYRIIDIYQITNGAQQHALKKLLRAGQSVKDTLHDIKEIEDSCRRWREMLLEDRVPAPEQKTERELHAEEAVKAMQTTATKNMARKNSLSNLLTYQGLTIIQIEAALASRGYNAHGLDEDLRWLVSNGIAYFNPVGGVWCRKVL